MLRKSLLIALIVVMAVVVIALVSLHVVGARTELFQQPVATSWNMEISILADTSRYASEHPIENAFWYGDPPESLQCALNKHIAQQKQMAPSPKAIKWQTPSQKADLDASLVHKALQSFITDTGLYDRGYYIVMALLRGYDKSVDEKHTLLDLKACVYLPHTVYAKTIDFQVLIASEVYLIEASVRGIIHESYLPTGRRPWGIGNE